jgi:catechol 2,3-dioxygenase-like lactoylglutathione lyase family enzyme
VRRLRIRLTGAVSRLRADRVRQYLWDGAGVPVDALTPYAHVVDLERSIAFYAQLGFSVRNEFRDGDRLSWAFRTTRSPEPNEASGRLMLGLAEQPGDPHRQGVLFYCWSPDVAQLRDELLAADIEVSAIGHPAYMHAGEIEVRDPDGYLLVIGQLGE